MKQFITPDAKVNEIRMLMNRRGYKDKVFILLEGKTDLKLFRKLFDTHKVQLETLDGKENVKSVVKNISKNTVSRIIGICDADFDHVNMIHPEQFIYFTDKHDIESTIIHAIGIDSIIAEYATPYFFDGLKRNLLTKALNISFEIGLFKLVNCKNRFKLKFKGIELEDFVSIKNLNIEFCLNKYIQAVINNSHKEDTLTTTQFLHEMNNYRDIGYCKYMISCGHDLSKLISIILNQKEISTELPVTQDKVESDLRKSYSISHFCNSNLFRTISDWQTTNKKEILAEQCFQ